MSMNVSECVGVFFFMSLVWAVRQLLFHGLTLKTSMSTIFRPDDFQCSTPENTSDTCRRDSSAMSGHSTVLYETLDCR